MAKINKPLKIVVFDMDETLGCFVEVNIFWNALMKFYGKELKQDDFFELMDLYPEFLRPKIIKILDYIKDKKQRKVCDQLMIYTNNQGPKSWAQMISEYLNHKVGSKIFDKIIAAFKVQGKIVELGRTSHNKSVEDLVRCTKVPPNTEICFIDDQYHKLMEQENVYYINVLPYEYNLSYDTMIERYYNKYKDKINLIESVTTKEEFIEKMKIILNKYDYIIKNKSENEYNADKVISKQIMIHLEKFFNNPKTNNTRKHLKKHKKYSTTKKNKIL